MSDDPFHGLDDPADADGQDPDAHDPGYVDELADGDTDTDLAHDDLFDLDDASELTPEPDADDVPADDPSDEHSSTDDETASQVDDTADRPVEISVDDIELDAAYPDDLGGALGDLGIDPATYATTMQLLGLDEAADGRSVVVTLERLGVDAHLEFGDVDRIATHLDDGAEIRFSSGHVLTDLDDRTDEAVLERDGTTVRLPLEAIEDAWIDHGFESVVTRGADRVIVFLPISGDDPRSGGISG